MRLHSIDSCMHEHATIWFHSWDFLPTAYKIRRHEECMTHLSADNGYPWHRLLMIHFQYAIIFLVVIVIINVNVIEQIIINIIIITMIVLSPKSILAIIIATWGFIFIIIIIIGDTNPVFRIKINQTTLGNIKPEYMTILATRHQWVP